MFLFIGFDFAIGSDIDSNYAFRGFAVIKKKYMEGRKNGNRDQAVTREYI